MGTRGGGVEAEYGGKWRENGLLFELDSPWGIVGWSLRGPEISALGTVQACRCRADDAYHQAPIYQPRAARVPNLK